MNLRDKVSVLAAVSVLGGMDLGCQKVNQLRPACEIEDIDYVSSVDQGYTNITHRYYVGEMRLKVHRAIVKVDDCYGYATREEDGLVYVNTVKSCIEDEKQVDISKFKTEKQVLSVSSDDFECEDSLCQVELEKGQLSAVYSEVSDYAWWHLEEEWNARIYRDMKYVAMPCENDMWAVYSYSGSIDELRNGDVRFKRENSSYCNPASGSPVFLATKIEGNFDRGCGEALLTTRYQYKTFEGYVESVTNDGFDIKFFD